MTRVCLDTRLIQDWNSFHCVFAEAFGFPDYYGHNMNAWIDCMTYLNDPSCVDTKVKANPGEVVVLQLDYVDDHQPKRQNFLGGRSHARQRS